MYIIQKEKEASTKFSLIIVIKTESLFLQIRFNSIAQFFRNSNVIQFDVDGQTSGFISILISDSNKNKIIYKYFSFFSIFFSH